MLFSTNVTECFTLISYYRGTYLFNNDDEDMLEHRRNVDYFAKNNKVMQRAVVCLDDMNAEERIAYRRVEKANTRRKNFKKLL